MKLTDFHIKSLIDERYREHGKEYFVQGMVELSTSGKARGL